MKQLIGLSLLFLLIPVLTTLQAQDEELLYIEWFGEDEVANELVMRGIGHMMNIEREKAYTYFDAAVAQDPSLFAPHVPLSWFSRGDKRAYHKVQAQKLVAGKNEPSRLFVSLLDPPEEDGRQYWQATWKKMHEVAPDGKYIHYQYAVSLTEPADRIAELGKLAALLDAEGSSSGHVHNILGYIHYAEGNKEKAKMHFEKYLELYPEGYNAYDSMAEYYKNEGDLNKALSYYRKAKEHYPPAVNATNEIEEITGKLDEKGNLVLLTTEYVNPAHVGDYVKWGKEYKAIADKTNFHDFYVSSSAGAFHYAAMVGKTLADLEAYDKEWEEWASNNEELQTMYEKYKHTVSNIERSLWRHSPELSYAPEGYVDGGQSTYVRAYKGTIKFGHDEAVKGLMAEFKKEWTTHEISHPFNVYWNVFGEKGPCIVVHSAYADASAWMAEQKEVSEKIGEARLTELMTEWNKHINEWEEMERFPQKDLTHINAPALAAND